MNESGEVSLLLSRDQMSVMVDSAALSCWMVCGGESFNDPCYRYKIEAIQQSIFQQAWDMGLRDQLWRCPKDGLLYHVGFDEHEGAAWQAIQDYNEDSFRVEFARRFSLELVARENNRENECGRDLESRVSSLEGSLLDMLERFGLSRLMLLPTVMAG